MSSTPPAATAPPRRRPWAALVLLCALPLVLRALPVGHGLPRNYVPDSHVVRSALGMLRDRDPVPPVGRYSTYPNLLPYLLVPVYAGHFAFGLARGEWAGPAEYGDALSADPSPAHLLARWLVLLFGAATPWVIFRLARELGLARGAWVAALLVATSLLHVHFSVQERPWVPMAFFFALGAWAAAVHARRGGLRPLVLSGGAAGLAFACHQAGLGAAALPALAWWLGPLGWRGADLRRRGLAALSSAATFCVLSLTLGHPYLFVYGPTGTDAVVGGDAVDLSVGGQGLRLGFALDSGWRLGGSLVSHDPLLVVLALLGLGAALRSRGARGGVLFLLAWTLFFGFHENDKIRYLLPAVVLMAVPAGFAAERLAASRRGVLLLGVALLLPLVQSARLGQVLARPDTRALAEASVPAVLPVGARLAVDRYGPDVELDRASLERLAELRARTGGELSTRERARLERLRAGSERRPGIDAVFLNELFEFVERETVDPRRGRLARGVHVRAGLEGLGHDPATVLEGLGVTHLLLANRLGAGTAEHLLVGFVGARTPTLRVDPFDGPLASRVGHTDASLPMEMDRPLLALWAVARPGPWLGLYALDGRAR